MSNRMSDDDKRVYDMVVRRFLAIFHPEAQFENTRVETLSSHTSSATRGKLLVVPGWRGVYGETPAEAKSDSDEDEATDQQLRA